MNINDPDIYLTVPHKFQTSELKVKGSKFIAHVIHAGNRKKAEELYQQIKQKYHDATHNCFAYRINESEFRYSDDGEPSGTAGLPIYNVLQNLNLIELLLVVTRYFGGTKLGTGGLARAYSDAASQCIEQSKKIQKTKYITISLKTNYSRYNDLLRLVSKFNGKFTQSDYQDIVDLTLQVPKSKFDLFQKEFEQNFYDIDVVQK